MNKTSKWTLIIVGSLLIAAGLLWGGLGVGQAFAAPGYVGSPMMGGGMMGGGMPGGMGGSGMMNGGMMGNMPAGVMHDAMFDALAAGLGIDRETLDERTASGETLYQIAESLGFSEAEFLQIHETARQTAIQQMVEQGYLTQEQADWMLNHMNGTGVGPGNCPHFDTAGTTSS